MKFAKVCSAEFDVAIVGGGPAAAVCALELVRHGERVSLIHRGRNPIGQIELLSGRAGRLLEELLNKSLLELMSGVEVHETVSLWGTSSPVSWNAIRNPWGPGIAVNRDILDQTLRNIASHVGTHIFVDTVVSSIERKNNLWQLHLQHGRTVTLLQCHFLGVATGRKDVHWLQRTEKRQSSMLALTARLTSKSTENDHTLYLESARDGWWYSLPYIEGDSFVGYCIKTEAVKQRQISLYELFLRGLRRTRLIADIVSVPSNRVPIRGQLANVQTYDKISGPGWIAMGDAAFAPDPLSGTGIEFAIESAMSAARAIYSGSESSSIADYENWVNDYSVQHNEALSFHLGVAGIS